MGKKSKQSKSASLPSVFRAFRGIRLPNIAIIMFAVMLVYILVSYYNFRTKTKVGFYEVTEGSIEENDRYTGMILRDEQVYKAVDEGFVNFYTKDRKRVSAGSKIYYVDKEDKLGELIKNNAGTGVEISEEIYHALKNQLTAFSLGYTDNQFASVYNTRSSLDVQMAEYSGISSIENVDQLLKENAVEYSEGSVENSGTVSFTTDTLTGTTIDALSAELFDESKNSIVRHGTGEQVTKDSDLFKVVKSDNWSLVFPMKEEQIEKYKDFGRLTVQISKGGMQISGDYEVVSAEDGKRYGKISFDRYMVEFIDDRYLDFEVQNTMIVGLKIPKEAVVDETFYLVPKEYLTYGANNVNKGFNKEIVSNGEVSIEYVQAEIFYESPDGMLYVKAEEDSLRDGDTLVKPDSADERYVIGPQDNLEGVYNINKGYTLFKRIEILSSNDEFNIVKKGTDYGLSVYDHILQKGAGYREKDVIYQ